jgi:hypothetical protein
MEMGITQRQLLQMVGDRIAGGCVWADWRLGSPAAGYNPARCMHRWQACSALQWIVSQQRQEPVAHS